VAINAGKVRAKIRQQEVVRDREDTHDDYSSSETVLTENQLVALARDAQIRNNLEGAKGEVVATPAKKSDPNREAVKAKNRAKHDAKTALRRANKKAAVQVEHVARMALIQNEKQAKRDNATGVSPAPSGE
jgi:hypothetical protein